MLMKICPLCSSEQADLLYTNSRGNKYLENYLCLNCGFVYVFPRINLEDVERLYVKGGFSVEARKLKVPDLDKYIQTELWALERVHFLEKKHPFLLNQENNCLEIGSGTGSFVWILKSRGQRVIGIEPDLDFAISGKTRYNVQIESILFEEFQKEVDFDLICSFHVIEHVVDPRLFVKNIHALLRDDGILFLECPTIDVIYTNDLDTFFWDVHINTFSNVTLPSLLESEGFRIVDKSINRGFLSVLARKSNDVRDHYLPDSPERIREIVNGYRKIPPG